MDSLLEDYKAYYKVRMDRYENDPLFPHSFQSEKALFEAIDSCSELSEFRDKIGNLMTENAKALVKDKASARLNHYTDLEETIRATAPRRILDSVDSAADVNAIAQISSEIEQEVSNEISADGFYDVVGSDLIPLLEELDITKNARIPSQYEPERQRTIADLENSIRERILDTKEQANQWKAGWNFDLSIIWETRHRKKIALDDSQLEKRLTELKNYL